MNIMCVKVSSTAAALGRDELEPNPVHYDEVTWDQETSVLIPEL